MTTRQFVSTKGDTWEWEETPEVVAAIAQLHKTTKDTERRIANLNLKRPHERQLGEGAKAEDILKIMESLGAVVMKKRMEDEGKIGPFGFIRDQIETTSDGAQVIEKPEDAPAGTVAIFDEKTNKWGAYELGN